MIYDFIMTWLQDGCLDVLWFCVVFWDDSLETRSYQSWAISMSIDFRHRVSWDVILQTVLQHQLLWRKPIILSTFFAWSSIKTFFGDPPKLEKTPVVFDVFSWHPVLSGRNPSRSRPRYLRCRICRLDHFLGGVLNHWRCWNCVEPTKMTKAIL